jgi:iron complex outermembrane recepter protein
MKCRSRVSFLVVLLLTIAPLVAQVAPRMPVDLPAGAAGEMIERLCLQFGLRFSYAWETVQGRKAAAVNGDLSAREALGRMLADTDLAVEFIDEKTLVIVSKSVLARREEMRRRDAERNRKPAVPVSSRFASQLPRSVVIISGQRRPPDAPAAEVMPGDIAVDEADVPYFASTSDAFRTEPAIFGGGPSEDTYLKSNETITNSARGAGVNLRGVGAGGTLLLFNGRPLARGGSEGKFVDMMSIPRVAIAGYEILADAGAAIRGDSGAGGIVNVVPRKAFDGAETSVAVGRTSEGAMDRRVVSHMVGTEGELGGALIAFEHFERDSLLTRERWQARSNQTAAGGDNFDQLFSNPGTLFTAGGSWAIPHGQDGSGLVPADFDEGPHNRQPKYGDASIIPTQQRTAVFTTAERWLLPQLRIFGEGFFSQRKARGESDGLGVTLLVPRSNAFFVDPSNGPGPVQVAYNFLRDLGPMKHSARTRTGQFAVGVEGGLSGSWTFNGWLDVAFERQRQIIGNLVNRQALDTALLDSDPLTAFNPFGDGSNTNAQTLASIRTQSNFETSSQLRIAGLELSGSVGTWRGDEAQITAGIDAGSESFESTLQANGSGTDGKTRARRTLKGAYLTLESPLTRRTDVSVSMRYAEFGPSVTAFTPRFALSWAPLETLTLRGTWGQAVKAPDLSDLVETNNLSFLIPLRDAQPPGFTNGLLWFGKNADLEREISRNWTLGFNWKPAAARGFSVALSYFDIGIRDRISQPDAATLGLDMLSDPAAADMIVRDLTREQQHEVCKRSTFLSGFDCESIPLNILVDARPKNSGILETSGVDLRAKLPVQTSFGRFELGLSGAYVLKFAEAVSPRAPMVDLLDTQTHPLNLRLNAHLKWNYRNFVARMFLNYSDSYRDVLSQPHRKVGSWTTLDAEVEFATHTRRLGLAGTSVTLDIQNVFDTDPPFLNNPIGLGYDAENADLIGRMVTVELRKRW